MDRLPLRVLYYGKDEPLPARTPLRAGPLTLLLEAGELRHLRLGDLEILRQVYVAVRDRDWGTVVPRLSNLRVDQGERSFRVTYDAEHREADIDYRWRATITGDERGTIAFSMDGEARSTFLRNRIGFCVLHPVRECAGAPFTAVKADGSVERGAFPRYISPHQPVKDLRSIAHEVAEGLRAVVRFEGELFEMEDHRNWTDASFKTYCTPLRLPYPVKVESGTRVSQSVTLTLEGQPPADAAARGGLEFGASGAPARPLPRVGLGVASDGEPLGQREMARLLALRPGHLRVDLRLAEAGYPETLRRAAAEAKALGVPLEMAVLLEGRAEAELASLAAELGRVRPTVAAVLVFRAGEKSTTEPWIALARRHLAARLPGAKFAAGTNVYFTELNRGRPPVAAADLVCYSINPQVHAIDNRTLVENLEAQAATVESARQFSGGLPLAITPVTLKPRFNPNATGPAAPPEPGELPPQVDARQMSLFGAGWTLGSVKHLAESGAGTVTYYETSGWRGVMERPSGPPLPALFPSIPDAVFPLYHVLADVLDFAGGGVVPSRSSDPLLVDGLVVEKGGRRRVILANLDDGRRQVTVRDLPARVRIRHLDETNAVRAMRAPEEFRAETGRPVETSAGRLEVTLLAYAVVRIDDAGAS